MVIVTVASFARHVGIPERTFRGWTETKQYTEEKLLALAKHVECAQCTSISTMEDLGWDLSFRKATTADLQETVCPECGSEYSLSALIIRSKDEPLFGGSEVDKGYWHYGHEKYEYPVGDDLLDEIGARNG